MLAVIHCFGIYDPPAGFENENRPAYRRMGPVLADGSEQPWTADDRRWFADHPRRTHRCRPAAAGETVKHDRPRDGQVSVMIVRQRQPGSRIKWHVFIPEDWLPLTDDDDALSLMFDEMRKAAAAGRTRMTAEDLRCAALLRHRGGTA